MPPSGSSATGSRTAPIKIIEVPRTKLFFREEHPHLVSVLLAQLWAEIR